jgi:cytochrome c peroxidase
MRRTIALLLLAGFLSACDSGSVESDQTVSVPVPDTFAPVVAPDHNPLTAEKISLGRRLFFDPVLSSDHTISCASCHLPDRAFSDPRRLSGGVEGRKGIRNSPTLVNVAYLRELFWDGGALTLENQVLAPLQDHNEMNADLATVLESLQSNAEYVQDFFNAFGEGPSVVTLTQAIASYERTIVSGGSRYDAFLGGRTTSLSTVEQLGLDLFNGKAGCVSCHAGFLFSTSEYLNNGLVFSPADSGRARITLNPFDAGRFRVPSLRNVSMTAPYMHDGRISTLEQVVEHYNQGGESVRNKDPRIRELQLNEEERSSLVAFLKSLTDDEIHEGNQ